LQLVAALTAIASLPAFSGNLTILPARELTPTEAAALPNKPGVTPVKVTFKTAASVNASRLGKNLAPLVSRHDGTTAAVYEGEDTLNTVLSPSPSAAPPVPTATQFYQFKQSKDA